ncbi:unnamed protein product [Enterobius vermicularis]|uniref:Uncharacterized protein n=1 Tax=Enterobius vermicularis TaxID=51028 RepID=A0A0N4VCF7_ENTVE|nr:unnamed protein product [Enterobius vermicularis]
MRFALVDGEERKTRTEKELLIMGCRKGRGDDDDAGVGWGWGKERRKACDKLNSANMSRAGIPINQLLGWS